MIGDRLSDRIGHRELLKMDDRIRNRIGDFFMIGTTLLVLYRSADRIGKYRLYRYFYVIGSVKLEPNNRSLTDLLS